MQGWQPKPVGNAAFPYGTPIHVRDLVLTLLKYQFSNFPDSYPYKYVPDDYEATRVAFDVAYNKESEVYGKKPIIIVERGPQSTNPLVVGDLSAKDFRSGLTKETSLVQSSVSVKTISRARMESENISQTVFSLLMADRIYLPGVLGIMAVPSISLSEVANMEQDAQMYVCQIDMQFTMQYRWIVSIQAPILHDVKTVVAAFDRSRDANT